ncbi:MAG: gamma-glutamyltransferase [Deltaproteobacteria bacterium]|nr:gamma-glutamyltransferase [Deltaproteobacteria bacterium]
MPWRVMVKSGKKKGVVASGHELTSRAGISILEKGGNAFDAAVAASAAAFVTEPCLTSPGGGGFLMAHTKSGETLLYDFFTSVPGLGLPDGTKPGSFTPVDIDFTETVQRIFIGEGSAAVPGIPAGLDLVYKNHCTLPLQTLLEPAVKYASEGVKLNFHQALFLKLLAPVMEATPEGQAFSSPNGELLKEGEVIKNKPLANCLLSLGSIGFDSFYTGEVADKLLSRFGTPNGLITEADLVGYKVLARAPLKVDYRGRGIYTNPPPSSGGSLIAFALRLTESFDLSKIKRDSSEYVDFLFELMRVVDEARSTEFDHAVNDRDLVESFFSDDNVNAFIEKLKNKTDTDFSKSTFKDGVMGNTTHISVLDEDGQAASVTTSLGFGSGHMIPGTGIMMNNMLGEEDLNPHGFHAQSAGMRMSSMMAPTIVMKGETPEIVLGSGGSMRIRSAILQVILNIIDFKMEITRAVDAPRFHWDGLVFQAEQELDLTLKLIKEKNIDVNVWGKLHVYFGGLHAAQNNFDGTFSGAGDPRRSGRAIITT